MNRTFSATLRLRDEFTGQLRRARSGVSSFGTSARSGAREASVLGRSLRDAGGAASGPFSRGLFTAEGRVRALDRTMGFVERRARGMFRWMRYGAIGGSFGLTTALGGAVTMGIRFNASMEQNQIAMEQFLGSTAKATKFLDELFVIAKQTPFEFADLTRASRLFLGFGFTAKQTKEYLMSIGDAIAGLGRGPEEIQRAVLTFGQIQAKGKVFQEELNQLTEIGIPAAKILRKELKLTDKDMQNIGKAGLSSERALPALIRGMNRLYGGASTRQAKTFLGQWSTFKDNANQALGAVTKSLFDEMKEWMGGANRTAERIVEVFRGSGTFGQKMRRSWRIISDSFEDWLDREGLGQIEAAFSKLGSVAGGVVNAIFGLGTGEGENPWAEAGKTAVTSFARGFVEQLAGGDILTSPIGRILEGYFGIKLWQKMRGKGGGGGGGADVAKGVAVSGVAENVLGEKIASGTMGTRRNPMWVRMASPMPGGAGGDGGSGPTVVAPPSGRGGKGGPRGKGGWLKNAGKLARGVGRGGPLAAAFMLSDAAFREDHNPFGSAIEIGEMIGHDLLGIARDPTEEQVKEARNRAKHMTSGARLRKQTRAFLEPESDKEKARRAARKQLEPFQFAWKGAEPEAKRRGTGHMQKVIEGMDSTKPAMRRMAAGLSTEALSAFLGAASGPAGGVTPDAPMGTGYIAGTVAGAGQGDYNGPAFQAGANWANKMSTSLMAGASSGLANPLGLPSVQGMSGDWGGTMGPVLALARASGLPITSQKRGTRNTASGGISDHWVGSKNAYATDLGVSDRTVGDPIAQSLAAALGGVWTPGQWFSANVGGMRWQIGWQVPDHYDHIHLGARRLHGGGTYRAPSRGGEGYALLRDGERVTPASGNPSRMSSVARPAIGQLIVHVSAGAYDGDLDALADRVGRRVAEQVEAALDNMSVAAVT